MNCWGETFFLPIKFPSRACYGELDAPDRALREAHYPNTPSRQSRRSVLLFGYPTTEFRSFWPGQSRITKQTLPQEVLKIKKNLLTGFPQLN